MAKTFLKHIKKNFYVVTKEKKGMICLHCGYCCCNFPVSIVDDVSKGFILENFMHNENLIHHKGDGTPCKYLKGNKAGEYSCQVHNEPWYEDTPCASYEQDDSSPETPCRIGLKILDKK